MHDQDRTAILAEEGAIAGDGFGIDAQARGIKSRGSGAEAPLHLPPVFHAMMGGGKGGDGLVEKPVAEGSAKADAPGNMGEPEEKVIARVLANGDRGVKTFPAKLPEHPENVSPGPAPEPVLAVERGPGCVEFDPAHRGIILFEEGAGLFLAQDDDFPMIGEKALEDGGHQDGVADPPQLDDETFLHEDFLGI